MVRAKFRVNSVVENTWGSENQKHSERVVLGPVYSPDPANENHAFWKATPSGMIELYIDNPAVWGQFQNGQEFYIDFTPATEAAPPTG